MPAAHRLLILGATGPTGQRLVAMALEQGHQVTALARRIDRLGVRHPQLTVVAADLTSENTALPDLIRGHAVVISALGRGQSLRSERLITRVIPRLVSAMEATGPSRLVFLSAYGVGGTAPQAPWLFRLMFRVVLADLYADKAVGERAVSASALQWTIVAPVLLTNDPATGRFALEERPVIRGLARISRADVAAALLHCIDDPATVRKRLVASAPPPGSR